MVLSWIRCFYLFYQLWPEERDEERDDILLRALHCTSRSANRGRSWTGRLLSKVFASPVFTIVIIVITVLTSSLTPIDASLFYTL